MFVSLKISSDTQSCFGYQVLLVILFLNNNPLSRDNVFISRGINNIVHIELKKLLKFFDFSFNGVGLVVLLPGEDSHEALLHVVVVDGGEEDLGVTLQVRGVDHFR